LWGVEEGFEEDEAAEEGVEVEEEVEDEVSNNDVDVIVLILLFVLCSDECVSLLLHCSINVVVDCVSISNVVYISGFIFGQRKEFEENWESKRKKKEREKSMWNKC
jgi:hypothetical protein